MSSGSVVFWGVAILTTLIVAPVGASAAPRGDSKRVQHTEVARGTFVNAIATTAEDVVWLDSVDSWRNVNRVVATPKDGGKSRILAGKRGRLGWAVTVFDGRVFWREGKAGSADADEYRMWLYEVPLAGGKARRIGPARGGLGPVVTPRGLVWSHDETLYRLPAGARNPVTVDVNGKVDPRVGMGSALVSRGGDLFYTAVGDTTAPSRLMVVTDRGGLRVVTGPTESLRAMAVVDGALYWVQFQSTTDGAITACALFTLRGDKPERVVLLAPESTSPLVANGGTLFWREIHYGKRASRLQRWSPGDPAATVVVADLPMGRALAADVDGLWYGKSGSVIRAPR